MVSSTDLNALAFLLKRGKRIFGEVENISQSGIYMAVDGEHLQGESAEILVYFLRGASRISVTIPGRIVRQGEDGIGFASAYIDPSALLSYEGLLHHEWHNSKSLMQDFLDYEASKASMYGISL